MTTTTLLRSWWAPACTGPFTKVALHGDGAVTVRSSVVDAVHALNRCLEHFDYRTRAADTGGYNCRRITGGTGYSLHAFGVAIDINWQSNPYGSRLVTDMPREMVAAIKSIRTVTGRQVWRWGGDYAGNKDAMHFEVVCHPADLAAGIDTATVPGGQPQEDPMGVPQWAKTAWAWAVSRGIVKDRPNDPATRAEVVTMLHRALHDPDGTVPGWAADAYRELGGDINQPQPNAPVTEARLVTLLHRWGLRR